MLIRLHSLSIVDLCGQDAVAILHNLTTNDIKKLDVGKHGIETFITNIKGKCLGHVMVFATEEGFRLIGAPGQSQAIAEHCDRYTIREDATPIIRDDLFDAWIVRTAEANLEHESEHQYRVPWLGGGSDHQATCLLIPKETQIDKVSLAERLGIQDPTIVKSVNLGSTCEADDFETFHNARIRAGFPWHGIDVTDANLPQEADRDAETISFTKGCYLGQETVARLDAMGQVQKKLVEWSLDDLDEEPPVNTKLFTDAEQIDADGAKPVGRLTSITRGHPRGHSQASALGFARRTHFEPQAVAVGQTAGKTFRATVVAKGSSDEGTTS